MGINSISDLEQVKYASAAEYGLDSINEILAADLQDYNDDLLFQMQAFAKPVTVQAMVYGTSASLDMTEVGEFSRALSSKESVGETVMFPIRIYETILGFTRHFFELKTVAELVERYLQMQAGHTQRMMLEMRKALFNSSNYTYVDPFDSVSLSVKRLLNADSTKIPNGAGGEVFTIASHSHYNVCSGSILDVAGVDEVIDDVAEHGKVKGLKLFINKDELSNLSGLSKYTALSTDLMVYGNTDSTRSKLDIENTGNRMVGLWDNRYEVWIKPSTFVPSGYAIACATEEVEKALAFRQLAAPSMQGLRIDAPLVDHPLLSEVGQAIYGFGVFDRTAAAVVISGSVWADPTLTVTS